MSSTDVIRLLTDDGWYLYNVKGSHHHFKHPTKKGKVTVPHPKKDLPQGTVNSILKQMGVK
ncbi:MULTISPECIES: type II toxin-antitoxin system HicA family toxin [Capnocytophaga]|uniref:Type II toxin-antitoxin system HicA family toxin n=1 Tax=Capnocytophaga ochracea TaxID=1018 RepID=A0AA46ZXV2_CAPOC|nr:MULTISPECIES: type II toxin-antitoxin system HicA family toxin [Capnocytophaga]QLF50340.1 type II toxin-antitoxin system HicA family toxin [Capnocytophaga sp. oral taxon 902]UZD39939.1 type II toxin-antitoxin system HicA family toxin [Capnocytophaga ochracea]